MHDLSSRLNNKQKEAVTASLGPVLVLAGAGSGKTRVLTYRVAYLIEEKLFNPDEILALTFTNKASQEMKERITALLTKEPMNQRTKEQGVHAFIGSSVSSLTMGTFHSVFAKILRKEIHKLGAGYSQSFNIYDSEDSLRVIKQIVLELGLSENFRPQVFAYFISHAKNKLVMPEDLVGDNDFFRESLKKVFEAYRTVLRENNALDFDDLLNITYVLFEQKPEVLAKYQKKFKYILVDEYQDTNHVQYMILKLLVEKHGNLFVVGDDAQSIYGFRGANMQNILDFKKDYPKSKIIMLEQNYRSTQNILDAAGKVIKLNPGQYEKKLWTKNSSGEKIGLYEAVNEMDESEFVLRVILSPERSRRTKDLTDSSVVMLPQNDRELEPVYVSESTPILDRFQRSTRRNFIPKSYFLNHKSLNLNDFVILYRTHAQSRPFEEVFLPSGIPYQIVGGIKFYERKEIKDVLSYLRLVLNSKDLVSLSRVINEPARDIGPATFKSLKLALGKYDYNFGRLTLNLDSLGLSHKAEAGAKDFFELMIMAAKLPPKKNLLELLHLLVNRSGYKENLLKERSKEDEQRWENVEELFNVAAKYRGLPWKEGLQEFLEEAALMTDLDSMEEGGNKLTLMTLHSAKGLEFDNVFFVGLEEGLLPHSRSLNSPEELAEEIRLAYVGMTRARKNLYLSYAQSRQVYGELKKSVPSRIIKAIPKSLINKLDRQ